MNKFLTSAFIQAILTNMTTVISNLKPNNLTYYKKVRLDTTTAISRKSVGPLWKSRILGPVHTGTRSFRSIFVPVSGTQKETVQTGTERLRIGFCFCSHGSAIVPFHNFLFSPCHFFQKKLYPRIRLGQKSYRSVFWTSLAPHCLFTRERNGTIAYRSTFRITYFIVPLFGTERCYSKRSRVNATLERSTFRNGTIWNGLRSRVNGALVPPHRFNVDFIAKIVLSCISAKRMIRQSKQH